MTTCQRRRATYNILLPLLAAGRLSPSQSDIIVSRFVDVEEVDYCPEMLNLQPGISGNVCAISHWSRGDCETLDYGPTYTAPACRTLDSDADPRIHEREDEIQNLVFPLSPLPPDEWRRSLDAYLRRHLYDHLLTEDIFFQSSLVEKKRRREVEQMEEEGAEIARHVRPRTLKDASD